MGAKIIIYKLFVVFVLLLGANKLYSINNGFYKVTPYKGRYCYVKNDTIWFNYGMSVGAGYIRFGKGVIAENGTIRMLRFTDKFKTTCDTIFVKKAENVNQLLLNVYDFRTNKEIKNIITYDLYSDSLLRLNTRIHLNTKYYDDKSYLNKSATFKYDDPRHIYYVDSQYVYNYPTLNQPKAVVGFESFSEEYELSDNIEEVHITIQKNEQAKYRIKLVPKVTYSEHFSEMKYKYDEETQKLSLLFTRKIHGFPTIMLDYLPIEDPDMDDILKYVFMYYVK